MSGDVEHGTKTVSVADGEEDTDSAADFVASHGITSSGYCNIYFIVFQ